MIGVVAALIPGIPIFPLLVGIQVLNGVLLPVILIFILILINDERLMGSLRNGWINNTLGWATIALVTAAVLVMFGAEGYNLLAGR